jgi:hypothetical protein
MAELSRRKFIGSTAAGLLSIKTMGDVAMAEPADPPAENSAHRNLRVQFSPGGHTTPLQIYAMFEEPLFADFDPSVRPHPYALDTVDSTDYPDVIITNDWLTTEWPDRDRNNLVKHLGAGRGLVVLHHAVGSNDSWKAWTDDYIGCHLYDTIDSGMKTQARLKQFPIQVISPVGDHPIVRGIPPFELPWDEGFPNMWISPRATPLFKTDDPSYRDPTVGWVGPALPKGRVCALQPGHTDFVCQDPNWRMIVHNMILWTGGRLA